MNTQHPFKLEVPGIRIYNYIMMNEREYDMLGMTGLGPLDKEPDPDFKKEMEEKEACSSPDLDL
jgi:hypothetical protein